MPLQSLVIPTGENTALGVGKETTAGVAVVPTVFHAHTGFQAQSKNTPIPRQGARHRVGQTYPATGPLELKISLSVESDPDCVSQLIAYGMGNQSAPATAPVLTTLQSAATMGATSLTVTDPAQLVVGEKIIVGTATAVAVSAISGTTVTLATGLSVAATMGANITPAGTSAYGSTLKLGSPLPTFTIQVNRITDVVQYYGCKVASMAFTMDAKGGLVCKFTIEAQGFSTTSATTPSFSTKYPFLFHNPNSTFLYNGTEIGIPGQVAVQSFDIQVNNAVLDSYYSFGNGRLKFGLPENQRMVTGKALLGFESDTPFKDFMGGQALTGPGNVIPGVSIEAFVASTDLADATNGVPYSIDFLMANNFVLADDVDVKPSGVLEQALSWQCAESASMAADDLKIFLINTAITAY